MISMDVVLTMLVRMCRLTRELDIKRTELRLLKEQAKGSESAQLAEAVAETEKGLAEAAEAAESARQHKAAMAASAQVIYECMSSYAASAI